jgi:hypothetical protein
MKWNSLSWPHREYLLVYFFGGFIVLFSFVMFMMCSVKAYRDQLSLPSWQETNARVIDSYIEPNDRGDVTTFDPYIVYEYQVHNKMYRAHRISIFKTSNSNSCEMQRVVDQYPKGLSVKCYYNPDHPERAVLDKSINPMGLFLHFTPFFFGSFGLWIIILAYKEAILG